MSALKDHRASRSFAAHLQILRRHARMLTGAQGAADELVRVALARVSVDGALGDDADPRTGLFRALHDALDAGRGGQGRPRLGDGREAQADAQLRKLSPLHRSVLLLSAVEGFSDRRVAAILRRPVAEIEDLADEAQIALERELETSVLIIEDEWAIARDLRRIVSDLGHDIVAVAATRGDAVEAARRERPGLVLADINLADGSSGVDAVRDIFQEAKTPTVFITAFPERLLTDARPEPTYLISKPYSAAMIQATVSQALFFSSGAAGRA